ncbi:MAG: hypothetical protein AMXMBFR84_22090 [Candidatus Hydrogenedentota bacterium]
MPMRFRQSYTPLRKILGGLLLAGIVCAPACAELVQVEIADGVYALLREGRMLFLNCEAPSGEAGRSYLEPYLAAGVNYRQYAGKRAAIPYSHLNEETQRRMLLAVFPFDFVDEEGWHHTVVYAGPDQETLWTLCEWLTGRGTNHTAVTKFNNLKSTDLSTGQVLVFPQNLLRSVMQKPTVVRQESEEIELNLEEAAQELSFDNKGNRQFAVYRIKPGDTLYTKVVVRFTNYRENADIHSAIDVIVRESGIQDKNKVEIGDRVFIPVDMLADRFKPEGTPEREEFEETVQEAQRLRGSVQSRGLEGVVVVLDPGHGGKDIGTPAASKLGLYEDEIAYDIVCRIKKILEETTHAKVYVSMLDADNGYESNDVNRFTNDSDESVLVTPNYLNENASVSATLRWYWANSVYNRAVKAGADPRKVVFTSIHGDALFNADLRGAMVYIPGARYRKNSERGWPPKAYNDYLEYVEQPEFKSTADERRRDEALSRNFAETILDELGQHRIKRHSVGDPIRNVIRQSGGKEYVVAVLRNNQIPTKVLIEVANLSNSEDQSWTADPWWRQQFAIAYVAALKSYFGS